MRRSVLILLISTVIILLTVTTIAWGAADLSRSDMRLVGHLPIGYGCNALSVTENYAFAVTDSHPDGLHSIDISNPGNPVLLDSLEWQGHCTRLVVRDQLAYVGSWAAGLMIVDISNPRQMQEVSGIAFGKYLLGLKIIDNLAYVLAEAVVGNERFEIAVDISNPAIPKMVDVPIPAGLWENQNKPLSQLRIINGSLRLLDALNQEIAYYEIWGPRKVLEDRGLLYLLSRYEGLYILKYTPSGVYSRILRLQEMSVGQELTGKIVLSETAQDNPRGGYFLLDVGNEIIKAVFWDDVKFLLSTGAKDFIPDITQIEVWHQLKEQGVEIEAFGMKNNAPYVFQPYPLSPVRLDVDTSFVDEVLNKEVKIPLKVADLRPGDEVAIAAGDGWAVVQLAMPPGYFQEPAEEKEPGHREVPDAGLKPMLWARIKALGRK